MPGFVKTAADEELWAKAKRAATHAGLEPESDRWYAFANTWFHEHKGGGAGTAAQRKRRRRA